MYRAYLRGSLDIYPTTKHYTIVAWSLLTHQPLRAMYGISQHVIAHRLGRPAIFSQGLALTWQPCDVCRNQIHGRYSCSSSYFHLLSVSCKLLSMVEIILARLDVTAVARRSRKATVVAALST